MYLRISEDEKSSSQKTWFFVRISERIHIHSKKWYTDLPMSSSERISQNPVFHGTFSFLFYDPGKSFLWIILFTLPRQKWVPGIFPGGKKRPVRRADNLSTFMCRLSWNLGGSTSWTPCTGTALPLHCRSPKFSLRWYSQCQTMNEYSIYDGPSTNCRPAFVVPFNRSNRNCLWGMSISSSLFIKDTR